MCLFIIQKKNKRKEKENQYKMRKIKEKKRKIVSVQAFHNSTPLLEFHFQRNFFFIPPDPLTHLLISLILFQTFFQLLYIFLLPLFPLVLPSVPIPL